MKIDVDLNNPGGQYTLAAVATAARPTSALCVGRDAQIDCSHVLETRRLLEVEIAGLAASGCTPDDIDRLAQILEEAELSRADPERFPQAEHDFHMALARATQNALYPRLLNVLADISPPARSLGCQDRCWSMQVLAFCRAIFDQVATGDAEGARQAMRGYVDQATGAIDLALAVTEQTAYQRA